MSRQVDRVTNMSRMSWRTIARRAGRTGWILTVAFALFLTSSLGVAAQSLSVATVGSGAVGVDAGSAMSSVANPALLGLRRHGFQLSLTPISGGFGNNAFSLKDVQEYFFNEDKAHWSNQDKEDILSLINGDAWVIAAGASAGARLAIGPVGLGGSVVVVADTGVAKDVLELLLMGNELNRTYSFAGSGVNAVAYAEVGGSLALPVAPLARLLGVKEVHIGGGYRSIYGVGFAEAKAAADAAFKFVSGGGEAGVEGDATFSLLYSEEGTGQAYDVGMAVVVNDSLHFDVALLNVGSITWSKVHKLEYEAHIDIDGENQVAEFIEVSNEELAQGHETDTPQSLRLGVGGSLGERVRWAADYTMRLKGPGGGDSSFGAGIELSLIRMLPLRVGVRSAMAGDLTYTAGLGLHLGPLTIDVGTPDLSAFLMRGTEWSIAASTGIRF